MIQQRRTPKTRARRVDFFREEDDFECALLAAVGMSTAYIQDALGHRLTPSQISYRLRAAHIKRAYFRNGVDEDGKPNPLTQIALDAVHRPVARRLRGDLKHIQADTK